MLSASVIKDVKSFSYTFKYSNSVHLTEIIINWKQWWKFRTVITVNSHMTDATTYEMGESAQAIVWQLTKHVVSTFNDNTVDRNISKVGNVVYTNFKDSND